MTDDTITRVSSAVTDAVKAALKPDIDELKKEQRRLHHRVTQLATSTAAIDERTKHLMTDADVKDEVARHGSQCAAGRRWVWGVVLGLPAVFVAAVALSKVCF